MRHYIDYVPSKERQLVNRDLINRLCVNVDYNKTERRYELCIIPEEVQPIQDSQFVSVRSASGNCELYVLKYVGRFNAKQLANYDEYVKTHMEEFKVYFDKAVASNDVVSRMVSI